MYTVATKFSELTGREIQNIWAVETNRIEDEVFKPNQKPGTIYLCPECNYGHTNAYFYYGPIQLDEYKDSQIPWIENEIFKYKWKLEKRVAEKVRERFHDEKTN